MFFFVSQEFTDDLRPSTLSPRELPDGARAAGRLLADLLRQRERARAGHAAADHQPGHGPAVPGQQDSAQLRGHRGLRQRLHAPARASRCSNLLPLPNGIYDPANNQYNASNSAYDTLPLPQPHEQHAAPRRGAERPASAAASGSSRTAKTTSATTSSRRASAGRTTPCRATSRRAASRRCSGRSMVNEMTVGFAHNSYGWYRGRRRVRRRLPPVLPVGGGRRPAAARAVRRRTAIRQGSGYDQADEYPYVPIMTLRRRAAARTCAQLQPGAARRQPDSAGGEPQPPLDVPGRPVLDARPAQLQVRRS